MITVDFIEAIASCDIKVGRYRLMIELMRLYDTKGVVNSNAS